MQIESDRMSKAIEQSVRHAIETLGIVKFKETTFFGSMRSKEDCIKEAA